MQQHSNTLFLKRILTFLCSVFMMTPVFAATPLWTFEPLTATTIAIPTNSTALVQYRVTNQSARPHTLTMQPGQGMTQITTGLNVCGNPFVLRGKSSCTLSLQINGSTLNAPVMDGPVVCQQGNKNQCYRPSSANILRITQAPPIGDAVITVSGSPLTLTINDPTAQLIINNMSTQVAATNITSSFTGTALEGNVIETGNDCANVPPEGSCTLTYTAGNNVVAQTNFTIQGTNTNPLTAAIAIQSGSTLTAISPTLGAAAGGTGFTLTGTGLTGVTNVTFDGIPATSVNVANSTTVTGVTPAHAVGAVDVVINTQTGSLTLFNGYTYEANAVGQRAFGGTIACLNGGLNNLIAATTDNSRGIVWGGLGTDVGAQSDTDGAANTIAIVTALNTNDGIPYAAQLCNDFEVDSQGNTPCESGNTCYNDWFLPAGKSTLPSGQLNCLYINKMAIGGFLEDIYWSSTEADDNVAWIHSFFSNSLGSVNKNSNLRVRCVRAFTP